jgi:hypothetical protein
MAMAATEFTIRQNNLSNCRAELNRLGLRQRAAITPMDKVIAPG